MILADLDPVKAPLLLWHPDCRSGVSDEMLETAKVEHGGIVQFFERMASHRYASVIPVFTSVHWLCIGSKKDIISFVYWFSGYELRFEYKVSGAVYGESPELTFKGDPVEAIDLIEEQLDFFVRRHKRLPNPDKKKDRQPPPNPDDH